MSDEDISGEQMLTENMAALDAGEEMPHSDDSYEEPTESEEVAESQDEGEFLDEPEDIPESAKKDGFMSKDDWVAQGKDPEEYMSAEDFARVGDLRDGGLTRQQLSKQLVQQQAALKEIIANQNKITADTESRVRDETIAELEATKKKAIDYGDAEKAIEVDREIARQQQEALKPELVDPVQNDMQSWYESNDDWYGTHTGATDLVNVELKRSERQGMPFNEAIKAAQVKVKAHFGELFGDTPKEKPQVRPRATSSQSRKPASQAKAKLSIKSLPAEMQGMARTVIKKTGITEQEYMETYNG